MSTASCTERGGYSAGEPSALATAAVALEKGHYPFKNYRHARAASVFFPGCNFPSLFPQTCRALVDTLSTHGVGVAYDCCGKPLAMMGRNERFETIVKHIGTKLSRLGAEEVVCVCPNCYYALRGRIPQRVVSIYAKLAEFGLEAGGKAATATYGDELLLFPPCPDRREGVFAHDAMPFLPASTRIPGCPGAKGACASAASDCQGCSALPCCRQDCSDLIDSSVATVTLCASCSGYLTAAGHDGVSHALALILGTNEQPDLRRSLLNRAKAKFA